MVEQIIKTLQAHQYEVDQKIKSLKEIKKDPLKAISQSDALKDEVLITILETKNPKHVVDYQNWLYPKLINEIKTRYNLEEYYISFNPNEFPSTIHLIRDYKKVVEIYPFEKVFSFVVPADLINNLSNRRELLITKIRLEEEIELLGVIEENPILFGKGNAWRTTQAMLQPKRVRKNTKNEAIKLISQLSDVESNIAQTNQEVEELEKKLTKETIELNHFAKRMKRELGFEIYNGFVQLEEEDQLFMQETLPKMREGIRQELNSEYDLKDQ